MCPECKPVGDGHVLFGREKAQLDPDMVKAAGERARKRIAMSKARPTFSHIYMDLAHSFAKRSTCKRLSVGAVITSTDYRKVLSVGYNGNATKLPNCCDRETPGNCGCLHAEENAVINCDSPRYVEKMVFVTHLPCPMCAKRLINLGGVLTVGYATDYRDKTAIKLFRLAGILCVKM
jgi:dCMP deaminase